jgi:hypothetical protein
MNLQLTASLGLWKGLFSVRSRTYCRKYIRFFQNLLSRGHSLRTPGLRTVNHGQSDVRISFKRFSVVTMAYNCASSSHL